jgi:WhiB family redox-sensing transcriptional regulator
MTHHLPRNTLRWTAQAACQHSDSDLFFPLTWDGRPDQLVERARRICRACPVQPTCLDWAVRTGEPDGMWGGATPAERRRLRRAGSMNST